MSKKKKFMCALGNCKTQCFTCSEDEKCDKKWGGTRQGSGAKPKYNKKKLKDIGFQTYFKSFPLENPMKAYIFTSDKEALQGCNRLNRKTERP